MDIEKIQTLHPDPTKINKIIHKEKYELVKKAILEILENGSLNHTELMEAIHQKVKDELDGNAQWYGETVKLDLEARNIIRRDKNKPPDYVLIKFY